MQVIICAAAPWAASGHVTARPCRAAADMHVSMLAVLISAWAVEQPIMLYGFECSCWHCNKLCSWVARHQKTRWWTLPEHVHPAVACSACCVRSTCRFWCGDVAKHLYDCALWGKAVDGLHGDCVGHHQYMPCADQVKNRCVQAHGASA